MILKKFKNEIEKGRKRKGEMKKLRMKSKYGDWWNLFQMRITLSSFLEGRGTAFRSEK